MPVLCAHLRSPHSDLVPWLLPCWVVILPRLVVIAQSTSQSCTVSCPNFTLSNCSSAARQNELVALRVQPAAIGAEKLSVGAVCWDAAFVLCAYFGALCKVCAISCAGSHHYAASYLACTRSSYLSMQSMYQTGCSELTLSTICLSKQLNCITHHLFFVSQVALNALCLVSTCSEAWIVQ